MLGFYQKGDTIIEVLLAVTVFSLVAVGSMTVMNQSANLAQQAVEITLVRQQIDAQAEALRAAHQAYSRIATADRDSAGWAKLKELASNTPIDTSDGCPQQSQLTMRDAFIVNPTSGGVISADSGNVRSIVGDENAPIYPQVRASEEEETKGYGLWIEPSIFRPINTSDVPDAYNFRIRACWDGVGMGESPMQLETTVRLYDIQS